MNPYQELTKAGRSIYEPSVALHYFEDYKPTLAPHIFKVASEALHDMTTT